MELAHPIARVRDEEIAHALSRLIVKIDRVTPVVTVTAAEVIRAERFEKAADGAAMVVDHIEDHAQAETVSCIDESSHVIGRSIKTRGRKKMDYVVAPPKGSGKLADRHDLENGHAELREPR